MPEPTPTPARPAPAPAAQPQQDSERKSEYVVCQEITIGELLAIAKVDTEQFDEPSSVWLNRKVLLAVEDGTAPTGALVRARLQRQTVVGGTVRWTPER